MDGAVYDVTIRYARPAATRPKLLESGAHGDFKKRLVAARAVGHAVYDAVDQGWPDAPHPDLHISTVRMGKKPALPCIKRLT